MADCTVTLNIGDGPDEAVHGAEVKISRVIEGVSGGLDILPVATTVKALRGGPHTTVDLEQGKVFRFEFPRHKLTFYKAIPDLTTALFSDLVDVVPAPAPPIPSGAEFADQFLEAVSGTFMPIDGQVAPQGTALRVGSFNIRRSTLSVGVPGAQWSDRKAQCAADALASGAKIIGLQEAVDSSSPTGQGAELVAEMNSQLGQPSRWATTLRGENPTIYDTTVVSLVPGGSSVQMLNPSIGARYLTADQFTYAGTAFTFASMHNHYEAEVISGTRRSISWFHAEALAQILAWYATQTGPVIVVGDFNNDRRLPLPQLRDAGLRAARDDATTVTQADFPSTNNLIATPPKVGRWLDHILTSPTIAAEAAGLVITFASGSDYPLKTPLGSDHHCAWADLVIA